MRVFILMISILFFHLNIKSYELPSGKDGQEIHNANIKEFLWSTDQENLEKGWEIFKKTDDSFWANSLYPTDFDKEVFLAKKSILENPFAPENLIAFLNSPRPLHVKSNILFSWYSFIVKTGATINNLYTCFEPFFSDKNLNTELQNDLIKLYLNELLRNIKSLQKETEESKIIPLIDAFKKDINYLKNNLRLINYSLFYELFNEIKNNLGLLLDNLKDKKDIYNSLEEINKNYWVLILNAMFLDQKFLPDIIFSDIAPEDDTEAVKVTGDKPTVLSNNEDYEINGKSMTFNGNRLVFKDVSTGYNIHYNPSIIPKAIIVEVYGGNKIKDRSTLLYNSDTTIFSQYWSNKGIIYITLNTLDYLKNDKYQWEMSDELHDEIHAQIDHFFKTIKENPGILGKNEEDRVFLEKLKRLPIFLYGSSFGGRTAIRHAELYPHTFSGYISHEGVLAAYKDLSFFPTKKTHNPYFLPINHLNALEKDVKILLMQNYDDNNVNIRATLDFYEAAIKQGQKNIELFIMPKSSPITRYFGGEQDIFYKGHFTPRTQKGFNNFMNAISQFIIEGPSSISISNWKQYLYYILANKHYAGALAKEKFISEGYRIYEQSKKDPKTNWEKEYHDLFLTIKILDRADKDDAFFQTMMSKLKTIENIPDSYYKKAADIYLYNFPQFIEEYYDLKLPKDFKYSLVPDFLNYFKKEVDNRLNNKSIHRNFLLYAFFLANKEILKGFISTLKNTDKEYMESLYKDELKYKESLTQAINKVEELNKRALPDIFKKEYGQKLVEKLIEDSKTKDLAYLVQVINKDIYISDLSNDNVDDILKLLAKNNFFYKYFKPSYEEEEKQAKVRAQDAFKKLVIKDSKIRGEKYASLGIYLNGSNYKHHSLFEDDLAAQNFIEKDLGLKYPFSRRDLDAQNFYYLKSIDPNFRFLAIINLLNTNNNLYSIPLRDRTKERELIDKDKLINFYRKVINKTDENRIWMYISLPTQLFGFGKEQIEGKYKNVVLKHFIHILLYKRYLFTDMQKLGIDLDVKKINQYFISIKDDIYKYLQFILEKMPEKFEYDIAYSFADSFEWGTSPEILKYDFKKKDWDTARLNLQQRLSKFIKDFKYNDEIINLKINQKTVKEALQSLELGQNHPLLFAFGYIILE